MTTMAITGQYTRCRGPLIADGAVRRYGLSVYWVVLVALLGVAPAWAQPVLQSLDVSDLPGGQVQLRFELSESVPEPSSFTVNDPARIVLDFAGVSSGLAINRQAIDRGVAQQVAVLEGQDRTRASISLARLVPYTIRTQGNAVMVTLDSGRPGVATTSPPASRTETAAATPTRGQLGDIDFRRGSRGEGMIRIALPDPRTVVDVREQGDDVVVDFRNVRVARGQERRLDVTDFATPVTQVDVFNRDAGARIVIERIGHAEFLAYQADGFYTVEVSPIVEEPEPAPGERIYTGELLSLNFQDIEVRAVLQILADFTGLNVVVSDTVTGNLTLRLQNVPWDQALDIILDTKGLTKRRSGNVIFVAPTEEVTARERLILEAERSREELEPLRTASIQVNYAQAGDLSSLIAERLLSERGQITADPRTNMLLIQDIGSKIGEIQDMVALLDIPVRQVQIDARIVIANDNFRRDLGVNWGFSGIRRDSNTIGAISGSRGGTGGMIDSALGNLTETGQPFPVTPPGLGERLGVGLGVAEGGTSRFALAILGRDYLLDLELSALQAEGRGETLSNPRVITTDRREAKIAQGQTVETIIRGADADATFETEALLELEVTPQITPDGRVIMDLKVTKNDISALSETRVTTNNREIETQVLVSNGETVVLGGVFENITEDSLDKVPFLGDIPAIGRLFRRTSNRSENFELLIFVTPQILGEDGFNVR